MAGAVLVISRHWHEPEVRVGVDHEQIRLEMSVEDFCRALVQEIPHPVLCFTRKGLTENVVAAVAVVLGKVKETSVHVPPGVIPEPAAE